MPIVVSEELQKKIDEMMDLRKRIQVLADRYHRSWIDQMLIMVSIFEIMDIQKVFYLPGPAGAAKIPVIEVYGQVIERRGNHV